MGRSTGMGVGTAVIWGGASEAQWRKIGGPKLQPGPANDGMIAWLCEESQAMRPGALAFWHDALSGGRSWDDETV
jgi:hypothetical protein